MELLKLLHILAFLSLAAVASQADLHIYWKSKLPNTPLPKAIRDLLNNELLQDKKSTSFVVKAVAAVAKQPRKEVYAEKLPPERQISFSGYRSYGGTKDQLHDDPSASFVFLKKDLHRDASMNLQFLKQVNSSAAFLPRQVADSIPFSSKDVPEILKKFSVKPQSMDAETIKTTIKECEDPATEGEDKYCATSLESMVDFGISKLGKNVEAVSTEAQEDKKPQKYGIVGINKLNHNNKAVTCHKQNYIYAVFYCHTVLSTEAYMVTMVGDNGAKAKAVAVCHKDTSKWSPKHFAFLLLNVKPGTVPICHVLPVDQILWVNTK